MSTLLCEIKLEESPIPQGTLRRLDEVTIKRDGHVWRVHKNDADPFPSNPHAHNVESGLKLDLSTGELYFGSKSTGNAIKRKHLLNVRQLAEQKGVALPELTV